jgi:hypothetical protein
LEDKEEIMNLLVEYSYLDKLKVINEGSGASKKLKLRGVCQRMEEENNNGRIYPKLVLESQVKNLQGKVKDRSLVGALDHPQNAEIHLSQASHLVTRLWCEGNEVFGELEILSTPNGKIVEALISDGVKVGISSRGIGTVSESRGMKIVNNDFRLITFDLVSDPSTKGAYPKLAESTQSKKVKDIIHRVKSERVMLTALESMINERVNTALSKESPKDKEWLLAERSLIRLDEKKGNQKDIDTLKMYLLTHLNDLQYLMPAEPYPTGKKYDYNKEKLKFLTRIVNVINSL